MPTPVNGEPFTLDLVARRWGVLIGALFIVTLVADWAGQPLPRPRGADAPPTVFSAARAWSVLTMLADTIGLRVAGTPAAERTADWLARQLRTIPGVAVDVQEITGARARRGWLDVYHIRNVLARLPGRGDGSVLVSAHYDSPPESVGAADDAVAVAAMVEMIRALASAPPLQHAVVFNINGAEEMGLLGAHGALRHRWLADARAFLDLESAGTAGGAILFQAGPGNHWLVEAYARAVPYPHASVIGQDIYQRGLVPSVTDFDVYAGEAGLRGLDIALYRNGFAYHTALDRSWNVSLASLQQVGANALALVRELADGPLPGDVGGPSSVYYDVLGLTALAYDTETAALLAALAIALATASLAAARWRRLLSLPELLLATVMVMLGAALAIAFTVAVAAIPYLAAGRTQGWYARPWLAVLAYGGSAAAVMLLAHWGWDAWRRRRRAFDGDARAIAAWGGSTATVALWLAGLTLAGIASAYLLTWWVVGGAVGLLALAFLPRHRWLAAGMIGLLPPALLTAQFAETVIALFVPIAGRMVLPFPYDLALAAQIAIPTVLLLSIPLALVHRAGHLGRATAVVAVVGVVAVVAVGASFPYAPERPKRLSIVHESTADSAEVRLFAYDFLGLRGLVDPASGRVLDGWSASLPAAPHRLAAPVLEPAGAPASGDTVRDLELRLDPQEAYAVRLRIPVERLVGWSLPAPLPSVAPEGEHLVRFVSAPDTGWRFTLRIRGEAPVLLRVEGLHARATAEATELARRLPAYATIDLRAVSAREYRF